MRVATVPPRAALRLQEGCRLTAGARLTVFDTDRPLGRFLNALSAALMKRRSLRYEIVFGCAAVLVATLLRFSLDASLPPGFPFLTFFPAVMLSLIFASIRCGIIVACICGGIAWFWFVAPIGSFALTGGAALAIGFYILITGTDVLFVTAAVWALRELSVARRTAEDVAQSRSLMFAELQHRVSNNLATIAALLRLQSRQTNEEAARHALSAAQARIKSISRLQRRLHSVDVQSVNAAEYLREVVKDTVDIGNLERPASLTITSDPLMVSNDVAVPLGLIASELLMNALEHGTREGQQARIVVKMHASEAPPGEPVRALLEIRDHGPGLPDGFSIEQADSLGLSIARQFAEGLGGDLVLETLPDGGTVARLQFMVPPVTPPSVAQPTHPKDLQAAPDERGHAA